MGRPRLGLQHKASDGRRRCFNEHRPGNSLFFTKYFSADDSASLLSELFTKYNKNRALTLRAQTSAKGDPVRIRSPGMESISRVGSRGKYWGGGKTKS